MEEPAYIVGFERGDKPRIAGTRIKVEFVAQYHEEYGWDASEIATAFGLTLAQVHAALAYYYDHKEEIDRAIAEGEAKAASVKTVDEFLEEVLQNTMTPQEVADEFPITVHAVYQAIRRGRLRARKSGKALLILRQDAERLWGGRQPQTK